MVGWAGRRHRTIGEIMPRVSVCKPHPHSIHGCGLPSRGSHIHIHFAGPFQGRMYLLVTDAHSKWPEIAEMRNTSANKTEEEKQKLCTSYRLPEQIVSDNGPLFLSEEFAKFIKMNGIKHIKSAPYHPSTNGAAEQLVQTFKKSMRAGEHDGCTHARRLASFLLSYRSTPSLNHP